MAEQVFVWEDGETIVLPANIYGTPRFDEGVLYVNSDDSSEVLPSEVTPQVAEPCELSERFPGRAVTGSQVENKWQTLERSYLGTRRKNNTSGHGRVTCEYESELADILEKSHVANPPLLLGPGRRPLQQASCLPSEPTGQPSRPFFAVANGRRTMLVGLRLAKVESCSA
ncbi:hypothetical protein MRX96_000933 [Rhipicephalus microplus]